MASCCLLCHVHVHHMYIPCTSHVYSMHITCIFHAHHMYIPCTSHVYSMHITCIFHAHHMYISCTSHVYPMHITYITCIFHAHHMHIPCTSHAYSMYITYIPCTCTSHAYSMYITYIPCTSHVYSMLIPCKCSDVSGGHSRTVSPGFIERSMVKGTIQPGMYTLTHAWFFLSPLSLVEYASCKENLKELLEYKQSQYVEGTCML